MGLKQNVQQVLGAVEVEEKSNLVRFSEQDTRLDYTVTKERQSKSEKPAGYTTTKIIKSGSMIEVYDHQYPIKYGVYKPREKSQVRDRKQKRSAEYRSRTIIRATNNLRRLIFLNFNERDKFITLTFNNEQPFDINNLESCLPYYKLFMRKLRSRHSKLKYITVPEFQKRGAVHYHILCNLSFIPKKDLQSLWPYGFSKPKAIKGTLHLSLYLCKYLKKRFEDKRKEGHRLFYTSQGLKRPSLAYGAKAELLSKRLQAAGSDAIEYQNQYETDRNGITTYRQYVQGKK